MYYKPPDSLKVFLILVESGSSHYVKSMHHHKALHQCPLARDAFHKIFPLRKVQLLDIQVDQLLILDDYLPVHLPAEMVEDQQLAFPLHRFQSDVHFIGSRVWEKRHFLLVQ